MSRSMVDAAGLPLNPPASNAIAGYLHAPDAGSPWPAAMWARAKEEADALLPIYVAGPPWNAPDDATSIETQLGELGCPRGVAVVVDVEHYNANADAVRYWPAIAGHLGRLGYVPVIYCSRTDGHLFVGRAWLGDWTGHDHQAPGATITQWAAPGYGLPANAGYDLSTIHDDSLPLWLSHAPVPAPVPVPPPVSIPTPDWSMMAQTDTTKQLDGAGRGYFDLPNVTNAAVHAWGVIGVPDPALGWAPVTIPVVAFTRNHAGTVDRFVIMGGKPYQVVTVRVVHD